MKCRIVAAVLVALFPLGMAACGSQSKADACKEIEKAMNEAAEAMVSAAQDMTTNTDTQASYNSIAEAYEAASKKITNKEIKTSVDQVAQDWRKVGENASAVANMDLSKMDEYMQAVEDMSAHQDALFKTCGFSQAGK